MNDKRRQWVMIQEQAPDVADWLMAINKTFGKPAAVRVDLASGEVVEIGVFNGRSNSRRGTRNAH